MFRPRVIPVLLLNKDHLIKSIGFKNYNYIGDPINAVRIFNELHADELVFLDVTASKENRTVSIDLVRNIGEESDMPFCVGGGINSISQIRSIISAGAEKVIIGHYAVINPDFIKQASEEFGSSTITVCIDVKKKFLGKKRVWTMNGTRVSDFDPLDFAFIMQENGAGEVIIQSIDQDGTMKGYDLSLIKTVTEKLTIPVIALGGAGDLQDMFKAYHESYASGLAAGSMFVYYGKNKGVLINYPDKKDLELIYG